MASVERDSVGAAERDPNFTVWDRDGWETERLPIALQRLEQSGPALPQFFRFSHGSGQGRAWDRFYKRHDDRFFKERHYLERDFPILHRAGHAPFSMLEVGCGTGASFYPLLPSLPHLHVTAVDLSAHAIAHIKDQEAYKTGRVMAFVHDAADGNLALAIQRERAQLARAEQGVFPGDKLAVAGFDAALMLFMLSSMPPEAHGPIIRDIATCLRPGGHLLFRDYGYLDEAQLRFGKGSKLDDAGKLCVRGDGTLAYYFTPEELAALAAGAGLEVDWSCVSAGHPSDCPVQGLKGSLQPESCVEDGRPCSVYLYRKYKNRAEGLLLRRVFVHAVFRKPDADRFSHL